MLLAATPGLALAQTTPNDSPSQPTPSQTNLQARRTRAAAAERAADRPGAGLGQADSIPTPTLGHSMSGTPADRSVPHTNPGR